jgi:hypothetical protein
MLIFALLSVESIHSVSSMRVLFIEFVLIFCMYPSWVQAQPNQDCKTMPVFLSESGFDLKRAYLSTSERRIRGLVLVEPSTTPNQPPRTWQLPSWQRAGWLAPMVITFNGEVWAAPAPVINLLDNKPEEQNCLWRTDPSTGELRREVVLPKPDSNFNGQNPYGVLGLAYDCENGMLYASSVAGSTRRSELGHIYAVSTRDMKVVHQVDSTDGFGLGVATIDGAKKLFFGHARNGHIGSIELLPDGGFGKRTEVEFSLEDAGPRGDDRARKIRIQPDGTLLVTGIEFYFNLTAPTEKQESVYKFAQTQARGSWVLVEVK